MRIVNLCGGEGSERDVSLASGWAVTRSLQERGHEVVVVDPAAPTPVLAGPLGPQAPLEEASIPKEPPLLDDQRQRRKRMHTALTGGPVLDLLREADLVFIALHGGWGEDGHVQALLEMADIRFTGAGSAACAASFHKGRARAVLAAAGLPVAEQVQWFPVSGEIPQDVEKLMGAGPVVVKPAANGSSVSVRLADSLSQLAHLAETAPKESELVVEPYLPGREFSVPVVGDQVLPVVEIELTTPILDYATKYQPGAVNKVCPARAPAAFTSRLQEHALRGHQALGFGSNSYSRTDFRCNAQGEPMCLEVNGLPSLTAGSMLPLAAREAGWTYDDLIQRITDLSAR
ncbi:hypothetical protein ACIQMJ_19895 [Actinosynnema sp. NPDC091369]